jgi:hypothetical protein
MARLCLEAAVRSRGDLLDLLHGHAPKRRFAKAAAEAVVHAQMTAFWRKAENICST